MVRWFHVVSQGHSVPRDSGLCRHHGSLPPVEPPLDPPLPAASSVARPCITGRPHHAPGSNARLTGVAPVRCAGVAAHPPEVGVPETTLTGPPAGTHTHAGLLRVSSLVPAFVPVLIPLLVPLRYCTTLPFRAMRSRPAPRKVWAAHS